MRFLGEPCSLEEYYRRQREGAAWVEHGGWRVWIVSVPVLVVMLAAFFSVVAAADRHYQIEQSENRQEFRKCERANQSLLPEQRLRCAALQQ